MDINIEEYNIYLKIGEIDLRKRVESLSFLVRIKMELDQLEKSIFIFCSKNRKRITAIVWNGDGWLERSVVRSVNTFSPTETLKVTGRKYERETLQHTLEEREQSVAIL